MGCPVLAVTGGVLEVLGFAVVAWGLARVQRKEFGTPEVIKRLDTRLRRIFRRPRQQTVRVESAVSVEEAGSVRVRQRKPLGGAVEDRLDALEYNLREFEKEFDQRTAKFEAELEAVRGELGHARAELDRQDREREDERKRRLRVSLAWQAWGTALFVVGAVLTILANTGTC